MRAAIALATGLVLAACNMSSDVSGDPAAASGSGSQRNFEVGAFTEIALAGPHDVVVTVGQAPSVRAEGDESELERLDIRIDGDRLNIGNKPQRMVGTRRAVTVYVTVPSLSRAAIAGSGDMRIDRVEGESFRGAIGGSGDLEIGALRAEQVHFAIAGSGDISARGQAGAVEAEIAGSGDIEARELQARTAKVSVIGSGGVAITASESADVAVMGSGNVTVDGNARCNVRKMGSGEVRCANRG